MRRILRRREIVADDWFHFGEDAADGAALIVPLAELRKDPGRWWQWSGRLGVRLTPVDRVEELADELPRLDLVAVEFPTPVDGRGYSTGRLLRDRYGYRGELRAIGEVLRDQLYYLSRCGFDAFALRPDQDAGQALAALDDFSEAYQASVERPHPLFRRRLERESQGKPR